MCIRDRDQLEEELHLVGDYGLRNKRELRGHETELSQIRGKPERSSELRKKNGVHLSAST